MKKIRLNQTSFIKKFNSFEELKENSIFNSNNSSYLFENKINSNFKSFYKPLSNKNSTRIQLLRFKFREKRNNSIFNISNIKDEEKNSSSFADTKIKDLFINNINNNDIQKSNKNNKLARKKEKKLRQLFLRNEKSFIIKNKTFNKINSLKNSFNDKISFIQDNSENKKLEIKLKELKERLNYNIKKHLIMDKSKFLRYNLLFKVGMKTKFKTYIKILDKAYEDYSLNNNNIYKKNYELDKSNNSSFKINNYYNCFSVFKSTFRYQDGFLTPAEFLNKYFDKQEISLMKSSPKYFGLDKAPFKFVEQIYNPTLLDRIQIEDGEMNIESYKEKQNKKIQKEKNKENNNEKKNYSIDEKNLLENKRKIYIKLLKLNKSKKNIFDSINHKNKKINFKFEPFVSHYERDIDPDEGTVIFFEKKFNRYLSNKMKELKTKLKNNRDNINKYEVRKRQILQKEVNEDYANKFLKIIKNNYINLNKMIFKTPKNNIK